MTIYVHKIQSLPCSGSAPLREAQRTPLRVYVVSVHHATNDRSAFLMTLQNVQFMELVSWRNRHSKGTLSSEYQYTMCICGRAGSQNVLKEVPQNDKEVKAEKSNKLPPSLEARHPFIFISISAALRDKIQLITLVFSESEKRRQRAAMNQKQKKGGGV